MHIIKPMHRPKRSDWSGKSACIPLTARTVTMAEVAAGNEYIHRKRTTGVLLFVYLSWILSKDVATVIDRVLYTIKTKSNIQHVRELGVETEYSRQKGITGAQLLVVLPPIRLLGVPRAP